MFFTEAPWVDATLNFLSNGLLHLSAWQIVLYILASTHITIAAVTIFLHRHQAHRALDLHPAVSHFFRLWLWLGTGMVTKEWVAIHRKHHAKCETPEDPHSPQTRGIDTVLWRGSELYRAESKNQETLKKYGHSTPNDWIENQLYSRFSWQGVAIMLALNLLLFGAAGLSVWGIQMMWIPFTAAGVINGLGHFWGYRNFESPDASRNISPWGLVIGGEELHNNHHTYPTAAKFSVKPFEFDLGWAYISLMQRLGLAKVRKLPPRIQQQAPQASTNEQTLEALIAHRYELMAQYANALKQTCRNEIRTLDTRNEVSSALKTAQHWVAKGMGRAPTSALIDIAKARQASPSLDKMLSMREELNQLWQSTALSKSELIHQLQAWCQRAEASGIASLQQFSRRLHSIRAAKTSG
jgi:stearoyl-CoA desaturase (Delta-9 desaturase)